MTKEELIEEIQQTESFEELLAVMDKIEGTKEVPNPTLH